MKKSILKSGWSVSLLLLALLQTGVSANAQKNEGPAVEQWRSFLPYYQVNALATNTANNEIYCATEYGFFTYDLQDGSLETYSKVNGMHDIGMSDVAFDNKTGSALLTYTDGNIDIFQNLQFYNVPDLKISQISGNKTIYAAVADNATGYLATGLGLVLVNIPKREISFTVPFYSGSLLAPVNDVTVENGQIFAATNVGLFRTNTNNTSMQDYATWDKLDSRNFAHIGFANNRLYATEQNTNNTDSVFVYAATDSSFHFFYLSSLPITRLNEGLNGVWVSEASPSVKGHCYLLDSAANLLDSISCHSPSDVLVLNNGEIWYADNSDYHYQSSAGLRKRIDAVTSESHTPDGPASAISYDISAYDGTVWVAHGGYNGVWNPIDDRAMFSVLKDNSWKNFSWLSNNQFVQDFIRILYDPQNSHTYAGSMSGGLVDVAPDQSFKVFNNGYLPGIYGNPGLYSVSGLALDPSSGDLWMCSNGCSPELTVMTPDGHWYPMKTVAGNTSGPVPHTAADVIVDDYGQLWFITTKGNGVIVYNPNGTPENNNDDSYRILRTGQGNGNLPDNDATCIAKTKDGTIWIGTANGIGIVNCPGQVIGGQCETSLDPVKVDAFPGQWLFTGQAISAIAVDAANRKWVGTGNGVWLLNTDGDNIKTVYRFTAENSPLPSDQIQRINIDPITGDVYISTDKGFVAFRSTATEAPTDDQSSLLVYPNPVPAGYQGTIAVRGVPDNADVRFTDITGKLVYKTTALGGQAVWNGKDYTGHKVQSGVYLIFIAGNNGGKKEVAKVMIQH